jgi:hypothetical protein
VRFVTAGSIKLEFHLSHATLRRVEYAWPRDGDGFLGVGGRSTSV